MQEKKFSKWQRIGAYGGMIIGGLGWVIGGAAVLLPTFGAGLLPYLGIVAMVSLVFIALNMLLMELILAAYNDKPHAAVLQLTVWGSVFSSLGILSLLLTYYLAPFLESYPEKILLFQQRGFKHGYRVNDTLILIWLSLGFLALIFSVVIFVRDKKRLGGSHG
jgi:hypothetical protein